MLTSTKTPLNKIPKWAQAYISEDGFQHIEHAIVDAEKKTSGELRTVLVRSSSTLDHLLPMTLMSVVNILAPEQPSGCPRAIAPPWRFTFSGSISRSFIQAKAWTANASLSSMASKSVAVGIRFFPRPSIRYG